MSLVTYETKDRVAIVRMDDGKANALSYAMMESLDAALDRAEKEASAVVLAGRAGRFCAGFDLKEMMAGVEKAQALVRRGADALLRLYSLPMPLVVACTGHALAGGALVVLTGDYRIAAKGPFKIGLNEVQIGMPVPVLAMELARDRIEPRHLTAATLFATVYEFEQAPSVGYVDELCDDGELLDRSVAQANRLAALPREAYAKTKQSVRGRQIKYIRETLEEDMKRLTPPV